MLSQVEEINDKNTEAGKCGVYFENDKSVPKCITLS